MKRANRCAVWTGSVALGLGLMVVVASHGQPPPALTEKDLRQLVEHDAKAIQAVLAKPKFEKKAQGKVKAAAVMIAAYAQAAAAKNDNPGLQNLRDLALKVAKAADEGKAEEAKKLAADLSVKSGGTATKLDVVPLEKHIDIATLMKQFAAERFGGFALEKALEDLVESKGPADDKEATEIARLGNKLAVLASVARLLGPEVDEGAKTKKAWRELSSQAQAIALELAHAAHARKDADISTIANRLSQTCVKCHDVFRNP